jgi:hypothetical protein
MVVIWGVRTVKIRDSAQAIGIHPAAPRHTCGAVHTAAIGTGSIEDSAIAVLYT